MKTISNDFKTALKTYGREFDDIITYDGNTLDQEDLVSVTLSYDCSLLKTQMKCLKVDSNVLIPVGTTFNYQLGLKVNGSYEYIDYGNFIVKEVEEQKNTNSYLLTCYDKMLLTMVDYQSIREYTATTDNTFQDNKKYYIYTIEDEYILYNGPTTDNPSSLHLYEDTTFPTSVWQFLEKICNYLGLDYANQNNIFTNYDMQIANDPYATYKEYVDEDLDQLMFKWESNNYTFRDVLDDIAELSGSFIIINNNDELEVMPPNKNLLDTSQWTHHYYANNGNKVSNIRCALFTNPIKVSSIDKSYANYTYSIDTTVYSTVYMLQACFFDSEDNFLGEVNSNNVSSINFALETLPYANDIDYFLLVVQISNSGYVEITNEQIGYLKLQIEKGLMGRTKYTPYLTETVDEEYFSDNTVNVGKKYGPINALYFVHGGVEYKNFGYINVTEGEEQFALTISDNPILEQADKNYDISTEQLVALWSNVSTVSYYIGDFNTKGLLCYELGDYINFSLRGTTYRCLMLNDEISRTSGLREYIYIDEPETNVSDYKYNDPTKKAYFLADKANGIAEMIVEGIGSNGEVTGASIIASINGDTSELKLNASKININGVTFDENQTMTMTEGSINIEQRPGGENSIYTYRNYPEDHEIHEASLVSEGMIADIRDTNTDDITMWGEYYASNFRVQDNSNNMIYGDATNLSMINSNHDTTFEVDGPTGNITTKGKIVIPKDSSKGIYDSGSNPILYTLPNNNAVLNASGNILFLGYQNTTGLNLLNRKTILDTDGNLTTGNIKTRNLFNYDVYKNVTSTMTKTPSINGFTITASQYANSSGIKLKEFCPQMEAGKTYFLSGTSTSTNAKYIYVGEVWNYGSSKTITQTMLDTVVGFYGLYNQPSATGNVTISNIQIEEGTSATSFTKFQAVGNTFGSNGNGYYLRFPSLKLQICYVTRNVTTGTSTTSINSTGNVYYKTDTWTYPQAFSSAPIVVAGALDNAGGVYGCCNDPPTASSVGITCYGPASNRATGYSAIAIGPYS